MAWTMGKCMYRRSCMLSVVGDEAGEEGRGQVMGILASVLRSLKAFGTC